MEVRFRASSGGGPNHEKKEDVMREKPICILVAGLSLLVASGCKDTEACTKARNAASDAWKAVTQSASKNKVTPNIGLDELPADKKGPHVEAWGTIEKQADMISSSFAYEKITWNTSDPA